MNLNPIPPILDSLAKVFDAVKAISRSNLVIICLFLTVLMFGMMHYSQSSDGHPSQEVEAQRFHRGLVANQLNQVMLEDGRQFANADRMVIRLFHNGQQGTTGIPFMFVKTTEAAVKPGISQPDELYMDYPSSSVNNLLSRMWTADGRRTCVITHQEDAADPVLRNNMRVLGVAMTYTCPIVNPVGYPVGYVSLGYLDADRKRPDDEELFAMLQRSSKAYSDTMASITEGENDSWLAGVWKWVGKKIGAE